ncbi:Periplasmic serine proteases (ClpP class) [Methanocella conradii HZ254]|uniref:Periplasmic serine proteases (ClpP class) n=1 Tax=Methanocella conradii (strain DSM 24694 / JCM 17849 / CGMCC 1.5162 / HZ254) TaxID=1041930 RepID=H8IA39_METCZ|nr:peptidase [Methanocella conradii]AFC99105.1 Periplasmic serine proteases (ClpP class) [Methanocella conradii HZ254]
MSLLNEYINKNLSVQEMEEELKRLILEYNRITKRYLFVYATTIEKQLPPQILSLDRSDADVIYDLLCDKTDVKHLDFYVETKGGNAEAVEEIVRFLRSRFETVNFVIAGEAKSAGTILVLSGDEIWMSETGSLGTIDAQMFIGRSPISAHDYIEWVNQKREEAQINGKLNPFDATMVAQITPGELVGVHNAYNYAKDLVKEWLPKYKFKNWTVTKTRGIPVTDDMRKTKADDIANELCNHTRWRSHGRPIKIEDLEKIGLEINRLENNPELAIIVQRIRIVTRLLFSNSTHYKLFATKDNKIFKSAAPINQQVVATQDTTKTDAIGREIKCPKCGKIHRLYAKFIPDLNIDEQIQKQGFKPFPKDAKLKCECGYEFDLLGLKNDIEMKIGRKIIFN